MELGSVVGFVLTLIGVIVALIMKGISPMYIFSIPAAMMIVIVCATGATMMSFKLADTTGLFKVIMKVFLPGADLDKVGGIRKIVEFAGKARRDGILALEAEMSKVEDPFMKKGLQMAIDGVDPEAVEEVLRTDIKAMKARHKIGADWCMTLGIFAPTFGIIGAVFGLIATMSHLNDVDLLAKGISAAFVATFWGVFLANGLMLPFANKLKRYSGDEAQYREMIMEGVLAIQAGKNPRVVEETLLTYLPPSQREGFQAGS
jgi:chemotaxis protein MotA